ncbi:MAG: hypothetical protein ABI835_04950 [Chloroflexota bacterium]
MIDLLDYMRGSGQLYELVNTWGSSEICQTQTEPRDVFFHVKNSQWEELWADDVFIYRGTDCSPGNGELYMLSENNHYGSAWVPRWFDLGQTFRRDATVIWRRKDNGQPVADKPTANQVSYLRIERVYSQLTFQSGIQLQDVAELHAYVDDGGKPASSPWEKYFYARGFGLVGFEDMYGTFKSWIAQKFSSQVMPQRVREVLPWLPPLQRRYYLPAVPSVTQAGQFKLTKMPSTWVNVRAYPNAYGKDIGDLKVDDVAMLYTPEAAGWVQAAKGDLRGWVSRQNGAVTFTPTDTVPPIKPPELPPINPAGEYILTQMPSNWVNVRDYPNDSGNDIGDLYKNDVVVLFTPEIDGWVFVQSASVEGWVALQDGRVGFTQVVTPDDTIPPDDLPVLPDVEPVGQYMLTTLPGNWVNIRAYPNNTGADVGDLQKNDVVMLYMPEIEGWLFVDSGVVHGWVSLQNGRVAFTPAPDAPPIPHEELPPLPQIRAVGWHAVTALPSSWVNLRAYPRPGGTDIGDLHVGDVVMVYAPEVQEWVFVENSTTRGWVYRQNGTVSFAPVSGGQAAAAEAAAFQASSLQINGSQAIVPFGAPQSSELMIINGRASAVEVLGSGRRNPLEEAVQRIRAELERLRNRVRN